MKWLSTLLEPENPQRARMLAAAPDFTLALIFLIAWIAPRLFGLESVQNLIFVLIFEFIILHSAAVLVAVILGGFSARSGRTMIVGVGLFYLLFGLGFSVIVGALWPVIAIAVLTINRMTTLRQTLDGPRRKRYGVILAWALTFGFYVVAMIVGAIFPWPALGLDASVVDFLTDNASGSMVETPQTSMAFGVLYYGGLGLADWFGFFDRVTNRLADKFKMMRPQRAFGEAVFDVTKRHADMTDEALEHDATYQQKLRNERKRHRQRLLGRPLRKKDKDE